MSSPSLFRWTSRITTVHPRLVLVEKEELTRQHSHLLHRFPNRKVQGYLLNLHRHVERKNKAKILQRSQQSFQVSIHTLPEIELKNFPGRNQPNGSDVYARHASKWAIQDPT